MCLKFSSSSLKDKCHSAKGNSQLGVKKFKSLKYSTDQDNGLFRQLQTKNHKYVIFLVLLAS